MSISISMKRLSVALLGLAILLTPIASPLQQSAQASTSFVDPAFAQVWNHCDKPVDDRMAARSWMWGPDTFFTGYEQYMQGPGGLHLVSYFDKSRMEINNPAGNRNSEWFVTNGLLVVDMITGRVQVGDNEFTQATPANIPIAGDVPTSINAPTYAALARVASLNGDNRAPNRTGQAIIEGLGRTGNVGIVSNLGGYARYAVYEATTGHNIPAVFWNFMNQKGVTYHSGRFVDGDTVVDWVFAMGYPITEPYWIQINVGGQERWVLMQAFQRRILTYSPQNPAGWQVEMGNVGRAYFDWRYAQQQAPTPLPTPTPKPTPAASIGLYPTSGDIKTHITINGKNFAPFTTVTLGVEKSSAGYSRSLGTSSTIHDGTFSKIVTLPSDAAGLGDLTITASANSGTVRATATFHLNYEPSITVSPHEIVPSGAVRVQGEGFPPSTLVKLGVLINNAETRWLSNTQSDRYGDFDVKMPTGNFPVGTTLRVLAQTNNGYDATAPSLVRVITQPTLEVVPNSGPVGRTVSLRGAHWPVNVGLNLGTRAADSNADTWSNSVVVDANGNFAVNMIIDSKYAGKNVVYLVAYDMSRDLRVETPYYVTPGPSPTPTPLVATISVNPSLLAIGQPATVTGSNWQASATVSIGVGRPGHGVEEWLATAQCAGNRSFSTTITLGSRWQNAGQLVVTGWLPSGKTASTTITVLGSGGKIIPAGLPMSVSSYASGGSTSYKLNAEGWQPGSQIHINVVSADGSVNTEVATAVAGSRGAFQAAFFEAAAWRNHPGLGVRAATLDGSQYSLRYLPITEMAKIRGTSNTYYATGANWPANARVNVFVYDQNSKSMEEVTSMATDANGAFHLTIDLPHIPSSVMDDVELKAQDAPYTATFNF